MPFFSQELNQNFPPKLVNVPSFLYVFLYFRGKNSPPNVKISWEPGSRVSYFFSRHDLKIINYFEKLFDHLEANSLRKFKNGIQILVGPAFLELLIETCKTLFVYNQ